MFLSISIFFEKNIPIGLFDSVGEKNLYP